MWFGLTEEQISGFEYAGLLAGKEPVLLPLPCQFESNRESGQTELESNFVL